MLHVVAVQQCRESTSPMTHAMPAIGVRFLAVGIDTFRVRQPDYSRTCNPFQHFVASMLGKISYVFQQSKTRYY